MSLRWLYVVSDAPGDSTDITDRMRLYKADLTANAEEGSVATSTVVIDDPDGDLEVVGLKSLYVTEDTATGSNTVVGNWIIADRTVDRGPYKTGAGRIWTVNLVDVNTILDWRVHVGSGNSRPAETDGARINWLMSTSELAQVSNTTLVDTSGSVAMDAVDYGGQKSAQVMDDCAQQSGKNYFVYYREASSSPALWYGHDDSTAYASSIRLTNVHTDITGDPYGLTFAISEDTKLVRSPSRVYSGALVNYDGGSVYEQRTATYNAFRRRDAVVPADNVKTSTKATARANRYLTDVSTEEDVITTSFRVPTAKVRFLREGMRCQIRVSHFPGYSGWVWARVLMWNLKQDSEEEYLITVDLSTEPGEGAESGGTPVSPVSAVLYEPHNGSGSYVPHLRYSGSGDDPPFGSPVVPIVGPIQYVSDSLIVDRPYKGFRFTGSGTVNATYTVDFFAAVVNNQTTTAYMLLDGTIVGQAAFTCTGGGFPYGCGSTLTVTVSNLAVVAGQILYTELGSTWPNMPATPNGSEERFRITGGSLVP